MSKFLKALEQAARDRALREQTPLAGARRKEVEPPGSAATKAPQPATKAPQPMAADFDGVDEHLVSLVTPAAFEAEQYRALRHIVEQMHKKVVAVSSPDTGDGKTLTAINLAGALAQAPEARVLLVDADLRRPSLARFLGLTDVRGRDLVSAILDPGLTLEQVTQPRPPFNLSVISAGQTPSSPYEVLKSPRLGDLLDEARRRYDYIVVDTPPLAPVQDCRVIGRWIDGFLLVVTAHRTPRRLVEEALSMLDRGKIIGFVFNQDAHSASRHSSGYYGGYYAARQPYSNGHRDGLLKRAVRRVGGALPRHRTSSGPGGRAEGGSS